MQRVPMKRALLIGVAILATSQAFARGGGHEGAPSSQLPQSSVGSAFAQLGRYVLASFYGHGEKLNRRTSTGERFNPLQLTAAHRTLPFGTLVKIAFNDREVTVRINDRGPAKWTGRDLDLSYGAARALGLDRVGVARVAYTVLE